MVKRRLCGLIIVSILSLPACTKKRDTQTVKRVKNETLTKVDIPFADVQMETAQEEQVQSFFDQDMDEFVAVNKDEDNVVYVATQDTKEEIHENEFSWVDNIDAQKEACKVIYFDFDQYAVRNDQQTSVKQDIEVVKKTIIDSNQEPTIVIEGHACHSAGDPTYNLALSEKRAKVVADRFIEAGIPADHIKIVGRGQEVPAVIEGKRVTGSRQEQWPNRRVEVHVIYG